MAGSTALVFGRKAWLLYALGGFTSLLRSWGTTFSREDVPLGSLLGPVWRSMVCYLLCVGNWLAKGFAYPPCRHSLYGASLICPEAAQTSEEGAGAGELSQSTPTVMQELGRAKP